MTSDNDIAGNSREELQQNVYQNFSNNYRDYEYLSKRAIMASTNDIVDLGNREMLSKVPGNLKNSHSVDMYVEEEDQARYDILNNTNPSGLPHHHLQLKKGAVIILIRNLKN